MRRHVELAWVHARGRDLPHQLEDQGGLAAADTHRGVRETALVEKLIGHAVLRGEAQEGKPTGPQARLGFLLGAGGVGDLLREPLRETFKTGSEEAILGTEELIDDRLRNAGAPRQLIHRRLRKPPLRKQLLTELDELPFAQGPGHTTVPKILYASGSLHLLTVGYQE